MSHVERDFPLRHLLFWESKGEFVRFFFLFWGFLTVPSFTVCHQSHDLHHTWSQEFWMVGAGTRCRSPAEGSRLSSVGETEKQEDESCHLPAVRAFLGSPVSYVLAKISEICNTADKRHRLPLGGKTLRVKFKRKRTHGWLCLLFIGCFWLAKSEFNVFIKFIKM